MKTTKILLGALRVSALVAVVLASIVQAQAQTVNVSFLPHSNYPEQGAYTGLGAASDSGTFWNGVAPQYGHATFSSAANTLENSTDTALTTVGFTLTGNHYGIGSTGSTFANPLLQRWIDPAVAGNSSTPQGLKITGLTAGAEYNLYLYSQDGSANNGTTTFTFGTSETATHTSADTTGFVNGGNYVEFASLTADGSGNISGTWYDTGVATAGPNGFQIQEVPADVPEPSTLATMSLAGLALLLLRKRFKKLSV